MNRQSVVMATVLLAALLSSSTIPRVCADRRDERCVCNCNCQPTVAVESCPANRTFDICDVVWYYERGMCMHMPELNHRAANQCSDDKR